MIWWSEQARKCKPALRAGRRSRTTRKGVLPTVNRFILQTFFGVKPGAFALTFAVPSRMEFEPLAPRRSANLGLKVIRSCIGFFREDAAIGVAAKNCNSQSVSLCDKWSG
jgi:hypothetical protein